MADAMDTDTQLDMSLDALIKATGSSKSSGGGRGGGGGSRGGKMRSGGRAVRRQQSTPYVKDSSEKSSAAGSANRVYVGNLAWGVTWKELKDHVKQAGRVIKADVAMEPSGRSKVRRPISDLFNSTAVVL